MSVRPQRVNADRRERGENMRSMSRARMIYRLVRGQARRNRACMRWAARTATKS